MQNSRSSHRSIYHEGSLYVAGGLKGEQEIQTSFLDSVERLHLQSSQWTSLSPLPRPLQLPLLVSVSKRLFAMAGWYDHQNQSRMVYEFVDRAWEPKSEMLLDCRDGAAVSFNDRVFIIGGDERRCMLYDPRTDVWVVSVQRPQFKHWVGAAALHDNKIILFGGEGNDEIEEYDPRSDSPWSPWQLKLIDKNSLEFALVV